jgi:hypothetical protein
MENLKRLSNVTVHRNRPRGPVLGLLQIDFLEIRKDARQARFDVALVPVVLFAVAPDVFSELPETDRRPSHILRQLCARADFVLPLLIEGQSARLPPHFLLVKDSVLAETNPPESGIFSRAPATLACDPRGMGKPRLCSWASM